MTAPPTDQSSSNPRCFYVTATLLSHTGRVCNHLRDSTFPSQANGRLQMLPTSHDQGERSTCNLQSAISTDLRAIFTSSLSLFTLQSSTLHFTIFHCNYLSLAQPTPPKNSNFCPSSALSKHENTRPLSCLIPIPLTWTPVFLLVLGQHFCRA